MPGESVHSKWAARSRMRWTRRHQGGGGGGTRQDPEAPWMAPTERPGTARARPAATHLHLRRGSGANRYLARLLRLLRFLLLILFDRLRRGTHRGAHEFSGVVCRPLQRRGARGVDLVEMRLHVAREQFIRTFGVVERRPVVREHRYVPKFGIFCSSRSICAMASSGVPMTAAPRSIIASIGSIPLQASAPRRLI